MRKSLDTRTINSLNKRKVVEARNTEHILSDEINGVEFLSDRIDGRKGYRIFIDKLYTGANNISYFLEENFDINEVGYLNIVVSTLPDFYFSIVAYNEAGDDLFGDYDISVVFNYKIGYELPTETLLDDGSGLLNSNWSVENPDSFMNFNGVWLTSDTIWEAE